MPVTTHFLVFQIRMGNPNIDLKIKDALRLVFNLTNIRSRRDLDSWCDIHDRDVFYEIIKELTKTHWNSLKHPEARVRAAYQPLLTGYKLSQVYIIIY